MNFIEAPICAVATAKLRAEGWKISCEIPIHYRNVDAAGSRAGQTLIVEAKIGLTRHLLWQLQNAPLAADYVIAAIGRKPRKQTIDYCQQCGYGIWLIINGTLTEILPPKKNEPYPTYRQKLIDRIDRWNDETVGGMPNLKGNGAAQETQRAVDEYRKQYPKATWKDIFTAVPSHYATAKNMYSALRSNQIRLAFRARMKAHRENVNNGRPGTAALP